MRTEDPIELELEIQAEYTTNDDIDQMAVNLLSELQDNSHEATRVESGTAPDGSKAGEVVTIGTLAVEVLPAVLPSLFGLVQAWAARGQGRTVKFRGRGIDFEGAPEDLDKLLEKLEKRKRKK